MAKELPHKAWTVEIEKQILAQLPPAPAVRPDHGGKVFAIDTPPPYPSGRWHIGAVAHYSMIDMIARSSRLRGETVLFPWGVDRNGINIELVVEKATGKPLQQWDRAEFIQACRDAIEDNTRSLERIAKRVAMSCDFEKPYYTDSDEWRAQTQAIFIELWKKGEVVEDLRPNVYDPVLRTTIADAEVFYEDRQGELVTVKWETDEGATVEISTTRPELICACQAVLVHPDDARYTSLHGRSARLPLFGRSVPVKTHPKVAMDFGTGVMMVCSFGDQTDVQLFRELSLEPIAAIGPDGRMTDAAGPYTGLKVKAAREKIKEDLEAAGLMAKREPTTHKVPVSERSKSPIEIILLKEWYVRQTHVVEKMREVAHRMQFHPDKHRQILLDWIDTVTIDWPVSRRRYYHTEVPIWYCGSCEAPHVPEPGPYYRPWRDKAPFDRCRQCGHREFRGEEKVFDTWMDSSHSNLSILGYGADDRFFRANFPTTLRPQGRDIVRTWLYYTALESHLLLGQPPFEHVWISGLGMDEHGRKMSKSLGNVIDPDEVLEKQGADAFRFWIASECTVGDDFRISRDRIEGARKFITKLYNVARFASRFDVVPLETAPQKPVNRWILAELDRVTRQCLDGYADFNFFVPATALRSFVWDSFASHYLEMAKPYAYAGDRETLATTHHVLSAVLQLLAPISPIVTYHLATELYGRDPHRGRFPEPSAQATTDLVALTPKILEFNSDVWRRKKEANLSLAEPISGISVPAELEPFREPLTAMHRLQ